MADNKATGGKMTGGAAATSLAEWERQAREYLNEGQNFLAHDVCRAGLEQHPDNRELLIILAIALSQTGAVDEAQRVLQPVLDDILVDDTPFRHLFESLRTAIGRAVAPKSEDGPSQQALSDIAALAEAMEVVRGRKLVSNADAGTFNALARVYREAWRAYGERRHLENCRDLFDRAFENAGHLRDGMDAAVMSWLLGDRDKARSLAERVREGQKQAKTIGSDAAFLGLATLAEAHLLLGEDDAALEAIRKAATIVDRHYSSTVKLLKQFKMLRDGGVAVPDEVFKLIKPPAVVVFTGHMIDHPGDPTRFPPSLEAAVRKEITERLDGLDAQVGYSMASCGSELLFVEAMLERGAEVNLVLPFAEEDFIESNVRFAGARWEMRFRNALKLANTVTYATEERFLGHEMLYRFANQMIHGVATLRAGFLASEPYLLAVWDMMGGSLVGGAAEFIDQWEDIARLRIIDLDLVATLASDDPLGDLGGFDIPDLPEDEAEGGDGPDAETPALLAEPEEFAALAAAVEQADTGEDMPEPEPESDPEPEPEPEPEAEAVPATASTGRVIRSMLFADIAGYSKLKEEHIPAYLEFLRRLKEGVSVASGELESINTWGDAIFAVMGKATPMAEYAMTLKETVARLGREMDDFPKSLNLRISLHAGPVFEAFDPISGRPNYYGSHINRAARLEPVTVIGHVYATQQFVAVLTAEQSAQKTEFERNGGVFEEAFACDYVGVLSLAKDFGRQTVYHLRRKIPFSAEADSALLGDGNQEEQAGRGEAAE